MKLVISENSLGLDEVLKFTFNRNAFSQVSVTEGARSKVEGSFRALQRLIEDGVAIYGVTTGFGDSSFRAIPAHQAEMLQSNLISYLLCGTGAFLPKEASRATMLVRLNSMCRGLSGVSFELVERMRLYLQNDWIPVVPREGSLGASGDLIPLAYLAQALQGEGQLHIGDQIRNTRDVLNEAGIKPYKLKTKEGLALVNGTSTMAGLSLVNYQRAKQLITLAEVATAWLCLALEGRTESFEPLINEIARSHGGQTQVAKTIRSLLSDESYQTRVREMTAATQVELPTHVQERYSLRCSPQILGPVVETVAMLENWLTQEVNSVSDNPLVNAEGQLATGGNFYGGYMGHGADYLKISLANVADLIDRQLMLVIDDKTNRGLPANLAAWSKIPSEERFLHHGLKGLHQAVSAITSEIMAKATPNSIFSRSSESHNQDKVSLGLSAAVQASELIEQLATTTTLHLICLAQALDLRGVTLKGATSKKLYAQIREFVPFVDHDQALGERIQKLRSQLFFHPLDFTLEMNKG